MGTEPAIRIATASDRDAVVELLVAQLRDHAIPTPAGDVARTVDALLTRPHRACVLVAVAGRAVGVAALSFAWPIEHGGRGAWLEELYVLPEARGRGTGERLLQAALGVARARGVVAVDLEVERDHARVASLYARHGFRPLDRTHWVARLEPSPATSHPRPARVAGGCLCGAVRYEIDAPPREVSHCHCASCRRAAGSPVVTWATYPAPAVRIVRGAPAEFRSSPPVTRTFCGACGTPLTYATRDEPEWVDVTVCSMDVPETMAPDDHIWMGARLPWLEVDDDLPRWPGPHPGGRA
jgi:GNAT superfamily N-acetyltransferase